MLSFKMLLATSAAALLLATSAFAQTGAVGSGATGGAMAEPARAARVPRRESARPGRRRRAAV